MSKDDVYPVEHFLEIILLAQYRVANEIDSARRKVWAVTIRDIETVLADNPSALVDARDRLARRSDAEGRRMYACACELLRGYDAAARSANAAIERARTRQS